MNIEVDLPYATDISALIPTFSIDATRVLIGSTEITSGITVVDFRGVSVITVEAQDGSQSEYRLSLTVNPVPSAYVSLELINFPMEDGAELSWAGTFATDFLNNEQRVFQINAGIGTFGNQTPQIISSDSNELDINFVFSLVQPETWIRPWYVEGSKEATHDDFGKMQNWRLPIAADGRHHRIRVDGSTSTMIAQEIGKPTLQAYDGDEPIIRIDFGIIGPSDRSLRSKVILLKNTGATSLIAGSIEILPADTHFSTMTALPVELAAGESFNLSINLLPEDTGQNTRQLRILSSDSKVLCTLDLTSIVFPTTETGISVEQRLETETIQFDLCPMGLGGVFSSIAYLKEGAFSLSTASLYGVELSVDSENNLIPSPTGYQINAAGFYQITVDYLNTKAYVTPVTSLSITGSATPAGDADTDLVGEASLNSFNGTHALNTGSFSIRINHTSLLGGSLSSSPFGYDIEHDYALPGVTIDQAGTYSIYFNGVNMESFLSRQ